jgi:hypothetical protein
MESCAQQFEERKWARARARAWGRLKKERAYNQPSTNGEEETRRINKGLNLSFVFTGWNFQRTNPLIDPFNRRVTSDSTEKKNPGLPYFDGDGHFFHPRNTRVPVSSCQKSPDDMLPGVTRGESPEGDVSWHDWTMTTSLCCDWSSYARVASEICVGGTNGYDFHGSVKGSLRISNLLSKSLY